MKHKLKDGLVTALGIVLVAALLLVALGSNFVSCSKQFNYNHIVVDINGHYVYFNSTSPDWLGNHEDAKVFKVGDTAAAGTSMIMYETEPDPKCYEYTAEEFKEHVCGPDADWRCPQSNHAAAH